VDWQQLSGDDLATALYQVRKAAQSYSRVEDRLLFWGQGADPQLPFGPGVHIVPDAIGVEIEGGYEHDGLIPDTANLASRRNIYEGVSTAYRDLENAAAVGPWALVVADDIFDLADRREQGFIDSPRERIENLLGSKIYRTSILPRRKAVLMGGAAIAQSETNLSRSDAPAGPVDRAVALEPELRYVGIDDRGRYQFFIMGSLALRIRDASGIIAIDFH